MNKMLLLFGNIMKYFIITVFLIFFGTASNIFCSEEFAIENQDQEMNIPSVEIYLEHIIETIRVRLETSLNSEIEILFKLANSSLVQQYFENPLDPELELIAVEEINKYLREFSGHTIFWINNIDHKYYQNNEYILTLDVNDPDNDWYLFALFETEIGMYNFVINYNHNLDITNFWINLPVFNKDKQPIGLLGAGLDITFLANSIFRDYSDNLNLYFFNDYGEITEALDRNLVVNQVNICDLFGIFGEKILEKIEHLPSDTVEIFIENKKYIALGAIPILERFVVAISP